MSALPSKADMLSAEIDVCLPKADVSLSVTHQVRRRFSDFAAIRGRSGDGIDLAEVFATGFDLPAN